MTTLADGGGSHRRSSTCRHMVAIGAAEDTVAVRQQAVDETRSAFKSYT
jgi:hypothetical protein